MKFSKARKIAAAVAVAAVVGGAALLHSTLAYLTDTQEVKNTITFGNITAELRECGDFTDKNGNSVTVNMWPGVTKKKAPYVKNTGANAAYVRLKVYMPTATIDGEDDTPLFDLGYLDGKKDFCAYTAPNFGSGQVNGTKVQWVKKDDGYYYLETKQDGDYALPAAKPGESPPRTPPLFTYIRLNEAVSEDDLGADYTTNIDVTAEAVQADGFDSAEQAWKTFDSKN